MTTNEHCPMCGAPMMAAGAPCDNCGVMPSAGIGDSANPSAAPRRRFRWQLIPTVLIGTISGALLILTFVLLGALAFGIQLSDPKLPRGRFLVELMFQFILSIAGLYVTWAWLKRRWHVSLLASIAWYGVGVLGQFLMRGHL